MINLELVEDPSVVLTPGGRVVLRPGTFEASDPDCLRVVGFATQVLEESDCQVGFVVVACTQDGDWPEEFAVVLVEPGTQVGGEPFGIVDRGTPDGWLLTDLVGTAELGVTEIPAHCFQLSPA